MNNVSFKRLAAFLMALVLCIAVAPASLAEDEIVLEWFVDATNSAQSYPARDTLVEKVIFENTGVHVNMTFAANTDGTQIANMIAGDTLPDLLTFGSMDSAPSILMNQMIEEDMLYSYQELDALNPGLLDACQPDVVAWWTSPDGNLYGYPQSATNARDLVDNPYAKQPQHVICIREDMWQQLGCPDMSTADGFLDACRRAEEELKTYNGYDIIGFQCVAGVINSLAFLEPYFAVPFETEDGQYINPWKTWQYRECLGFFNQAYRMGLLRESNFSDTADIVTEHVAQGRVFAIMYTAALDKDAMYTAWANDNNISYSLPVLRNSNGDDPVFGASTSKGYMPTVIPKSTKYAKEIAKLLTYLISDEGQRLLYSGVEGVTYHWNEDGKIVHDFSSAEAAQYGLNTMWPLRNPTYFQRYYVFDGVKSDGYVGKFELNDYAHDLSVKFKDIPGDTRQIAMAELSTTVNTYSASRMGDLLTAGTEEEFNQIYDEIVTKMYEMGLDELDAYNNERLQEAKRTLGVEMLWPPYVEK